MDNNNELNRFLSNKMSLDDMDIHVPESPLIARKKIALRKKQTGEIEDFFSLLAAFLNFKIKLYHAVIATVIIGSIILFFSEKENENKNEARNTEYISNIASVKSSTVLSSIHTFALTKEQAYANGTN